MQMEARDGTSVSGAYGAGNPDGNNNKSGTGGLMVLYANVIINNSNISANGVRGTESIVAGGSSGGGSINIFFKDNYENNGVIEAKGGAGNGGNGTVTVGVLGKDGTYVDPSKISENIKTSAKIVKRLGTTYSVDITFSSDLAIKKIVDLDTQEETLNQNTDNE